MRRFASAALLAAVVVLPGTLPAEEQEQEAPNLRPIRWEEVDTASGEVLFHNLCAACHGEHALGDGPVAEALQAVVPNLTRLAERNDGEFPLHEVEDKIRGGTRAHGTTRMPVWGPSLMAVRDDWPEAQRKMFVANRIRKLAEYLESIQVDDE